MNINTYTTLHTGPFYIDDTLTSPLLGLYILEKSNGANLEELQYFQAEPYCKNLDRSNINNSIPEWVYSRYHMYSRSALLQNTNRSLWSELKVNSLTLKVSSNTPYEPTTITGSLLEAVVENIDYSTSQQKQKNINQRWIGDEYIVTFKLTFREPMLILHTLECVHQFFEFLVYLNPSFRFINECFLISTNAENVKIFLPQYHAPQNREGLSLNQSLCQTKNLADSYFHWSTLKDPLIHYRHLRENFIPGTFHWSDNVFLAHAFHWFEGTLRTYTDHHAKGTGQDNSIVYIVKTSELFNDLSELNTHTRKLVSLLKGSTRYVTSLVHNTCTSCATLTRDAKCTLCSHDIEYKKAVEGVKIDSIQWVLLFILTERNLDHHLLLKNRVLLNTDATIMNSDENILYEMACYLCNLTWLLSLKQMHFTCHNAIGYTNFLDTIELA